MSSSSAKEVKPTPYSQVSASSSHGHFSIDYEEDDDEQASGDGNGKPVERSLSLNDFTNISNATPALTNDPFYLPKAVWNLVTFGWMKPLLKLGNERALEQTDLLPLRDSDRADNIYLRFSKYWVEQLQMYNVNFDENAEVDPSTIPSSLTKSFFQAFGLPFVLSGGLKLIHDSCLFIGPLLLNLLIKFLNDPDQPFMQGVWYVVALFCTQFCMSVCLRQYFWRCYRVGMNLRAAVVTSVFSKALVLSTPALGKRSAGEITNLMSVDSERLQSLTPYLHAIWYSLYQIAVAMFFLFQLLGPSCFTGMTIIIVSIPVTGRISKYMKTLQKELSTIRDERIKLTNEVLAGMKVIKLQAWEEEFEKRIKTVRAQELVVFRRYCISQCLSGSLFTTIPLFVSVGTFTTYIALGNQLTVATALTALALFELLRFPLFMLPSVLNNIVEASVSVERVRNFLLQPERKQVPAAPLTEPGVLLHKVSAVWAAAVKLIPPPAKPTLWASVVSFFKGAFNLAKAGLHYLLAWWRGAGDISDSRRLSTSSNNSNAMEMVETQNPITASASKNANSGSNSSGDKKPTEVLVVHSQEEVARRIGEALAAEAEHTIQRLQRSLIEARKGVMRGGDAAVVVVNNGGNAAADGEEENEDDECAIALREDEEMNKLIAKSKFIASSPIGGDEVGHSSSSVAAVTGSITTTAINASTSVLPPRLLTLSRVSAKGQGGQIISVVGQVGSGKSTLLSTLLGDLRVCFGTVAVRGSVAYCAQVPFIQNSTLRENITYGLPFDAEKYQQTLHECALLPDFKILPAGDQTEIGERGINLSGGQKARVSLARAVYSDADVYFLDDPLSAVDAHVGQHLFEQCILSLQRKGKCVVLVTNALQFLAHSTSVLVLKEGRVAERGKYKSLMKKGPGGLLYEMVSGMKETFALAASGARDSVVADMDDATAALASLVDIDIDGKADNEKEEGGDGAGESTVIVSSSQPSSPRRKRMNSTGSEVSTGSNTINKEQPPVSANIEKEAEAIKKQLAAAGAKLTTTEDREVGNVDRKVYAKWATAAGGVSVGITIIILFGIAEIVSVLASWWLSYWSQHVDDGGSPWFYLGIYIVINAGISICMLAREYYARMRSLEAGRELFIELLTAVLFSPMEFYDTTPLGRIVNRFSKDIYTVDEQIPQTVRWYLGSLARVCSVLLYICVVTPLFIVALIPICFFYALTQRYYIKTSRELTRLESTSRSPIYSLFRETLDGMSTIRAYRSERKLVAKSNKLLNENQNAYFLNFSANCWLAVRLEFAGTCIVTLAALCAVLGRNTDKSDAGATEGAVPSSDEQRQAFAGLAGLAISLGLSITQSLNWSVRMASDLESQMVSVERVKNYATMPQEKPHLLSTDPVTSRSSGRPARYSDNNNNSIASRSATWPKEGKVEFRDVVLRYRAGLPAVLDHLSFTIKGREKIGIVGRTGAGKSSLVTALLRLVELEEGCILIDGLDASALGLNTLRSVMAVIPQDPVLFSGTIRSNLDPFLKYTDVELWDGLRRTLLADVCVNSLDDKVSENGSNYSVGQRQLLCICRALLSKAAIIIMDEATAAVDVETDKQIQQTIRTEFAYATCLTIAHRLNTVMDADKILVMDQGHVAEFDSPSNLLGKPESLFYALVNDAENSQREKGAEDGVF